MAVCRWCNKEMRGAMSCSVGALHLDGKRVEMISWGAGGRHERGKCHDCGVAPGGFHHLGCDLQRCPLCRRQMMTCGCRFDEDGPDEEDEFEEYDEWPAAGGYDDDDEDDDFAPAEPLYVDEDGTLVELRSVGGNPVRVHHVDEIPDKDLTVVDGIPCTTALRTVIDIATLPEVDEPAMDRIVADVLNRKLFTVAEARARIAEPDMRERRGAALLAAALDRRRSTDR